MIPTVLAVCITAIVAGAIWAYRLDRRDWNGGNCRRCGFRWRYFDKDSQGGRLYTCDSCDNWIGIGWRVDR